MEKSETDFFKKATEVGMRVVDIGANVGYYTLIAAKLVGPSGKVYAFEPETRNFELLARNVKSNHYNNVVLVQKAVSNTCGAANLFLDPENWGGHSLSRKAVLRRTKRTSIRTVTLDCFFRETGDIQLDIMKIDIQGAEGLALDGAREVLALNPDLRIFMEFWPYGLQSCGTSPDDVVDSLRRAGFSRIRIIDEDGGELKSTTTEELLEMSDWMRSDKDLWLNLLVENPRRRAVEGHVDREWDVGRQQ